MRSRREGTSTSLKTKEGIREKRYLGDSASGMYSSKGKEWEHQKSKAGEPLQIPRSEKSEARGKEN